MTHFWVMAPSNCDNFQFHQGKILSIIQVSDLIGGSIMFIIIIWLGCAFGCYWLAQSKGRNVALAAIMGLLFGIFALVVYAVLKKTPSAPAVAPVTSQISGLIRPSAATDQLRELARLKDDGIISEAEFNEKKAKLLEKM
jgi:sugar phosphate permease